MIIHSLSLIRIYLEINYIIIHYLLITSIHCLLNITIYLLSIIHNLLYTIINTTSLPSIKIVINPTLLRQILLSILLKLIFLLLLLNNLINNLINELIRILKTNSPLQLITTIHFIPLYLKILDLLFLTFNLYHISIYYLQPLLFLIYLLLFPTFLSLPLTQPIFELFKLSIKLFPI